MTAAVVARDIVQYFESLGEGTFGQNLFVDMQPDEPDETVTIFDTGGTGLQEPPEAWRELYIQLRTKDHQVGYERIWRLLGYLIRPSTGIIVTSGGNYAAQFQEVPAIYDRDQRDRFLFGFRVLVQNVALAFQVQTTTSPDPVAALNSWVAATFPEVQIDPAAWAPTDNTPALYWRFAGHQVAQQQQSVAWYDATVMGHIIAPTAKGRLVWLKRLVERLAATRRLTMDDGSPMFITNIAADSTADYLRTGQMRVTGRYGVLIAKPADPILNRAVVSGATTGEVT
ncbi:Uncharacterized [Moorella glycerini]|uniref:Uncharacterized protein n=1 Tax=Neomoorella stamsii TaxID=1266720 RepID=A0A9X7J0H5_9FIRM|nr:MULTISPECIES: minor capsid protein [Moorella]PRR69595.1 hypothetical protein MOST_30170 [Moorella stamsii]CEP67881.1 Uncharacterized [Moorella glycerini]CEP68751.1 Uncharacterized [Moorella glycerini]